MSRQPGLLQLDFVFWKTTRPKGLEIGDVFPFVNNGASFRVQPRQAKGSLPHWTGELEELQELVIQEQWLEALAKKMNRLTQLTPT